MNNDRIERQMQVDEKIKHNIIYIISRYFGELKHIHYTYERIYMDNYKTNYKLNYITEEDSRCLLIIEFTNICLGNYQIFDNMLQDYFNELYNKDKSIDFDRFSKYLNLKINDYGQNIKDIYINHIKGMYPVCRVIKNKDLKIDLKFNMKGLEEKAILLIDFNIYIDNKLIVSNEMLI
jgi:hypothetical protein